MEVHTHTHTTRKKWTHYFWEFLMLFLAVFCGFLAENKREHIVEHQREKKYMQSMLSDLKADSIMFSRGIKRKEERINAIDSVFIFFKSHHDVKTISGNFFKMLRRTTFDQRLIRNTITMDQLKNAGGMRLIRNKLIADSISAYDFQCSSYDLYNEGYIIQGQVGFRNLEKMVSAFDLLDLYILNSGEGIRDNIPDSLVIGINTDELSVKLNFMMQLKVFARQEINLFKQLKEKATNLMMLIKQEYHLE